MLEDHFRRVAHFESQRVNGPMLPMRRVTATR
jgi:hypothetical protein